jgi:hypothetical protein
MLSRPRSEPLAVECNLASVGRQLHGTGGTDRLDTSAFDQHYRILDDRSVLDADDRRASDRKRRPGWRARFREHDGWHSARRQHRQHQQCGANAENSNRETNSERMCGPHLTKIARRR